MSIEQLKEFPGIRRSKTGTSKWGRFLDGQIWRFTPEDVGVKSIEVARLNIWSAAKSRGLDLCTVRA